MAQGMSKGSLNQLLSSSSVLRAAAAARFGRFRRSTGAGAAAFLLRLQQALHQGCVGRTAASQQWVYRGQAAAAVVLFHAGTCSRVLVDKGADQLVRLLKAGAQLRVGQALGQRNLIAGLPRSRPVSLTT
jgi:hypothetical protein